MRVLKKFEYYVNKGIVKRCAVDLKRAESLKRESENSYISLVEYVKYSGVGPRNSNMIVKMGYDVVMELIRSRMLFDGLVCSGYGAHEAEVSYLREIGFLESDVLFVNGLRYFRNGIMYYGKIFGEDYAKKVLGFVERIRERLK